MSSGVKRYMLLRPTHSAAQKVIPLTTRSDAKAKTPTKSNAEDWQFTCTQVHTMKACAAKEGCCSMVMGIASWKNTLRL